jgi:hypothetical protein
MGWQAGARLTDTHEYHEMSVVHQSQAVSTFFNESIPTKASIPAFLISC